MTQDPSGLTEMKVCENSMFQTWAFIYLNVPEHIKVRLLGVDVRKPVGRFVSLAGQSNLCLSVGDYSTVPNNLGSVV